MKEKWTVRGVDQAAIEALRQVQEKTGLPFGILVSKAIAEFARNLPGDLPSPTNLDEEVADGQVNLATSIAALQKLVAKFSGSLN